MSKYGDWIEGQENTCPTATMFNSNLTRTDLELNPGLRCERPVTNSLSRDVALLCFYISKFPTG
jgi:hypothetical protein